MRPLQFIKSILFSSKPKQIELEVRKPNLTKSGWKGMGRVVVAIPEFTGRVGERCFMP